MQYTTNGEFAVLLIPECKQYSLDEMGKMNGFERRTDYDPNLEYIIPYRKPYDRIIRAVGADLHEVMLDAGFVNLNESKWSTVRERCLEFIVNWVETVGHLPIQKNFCHSAYITAYINTELTNYRIVDVDNISVLTKYIKEKYNIDIDPIPELPEGFYDHTVPYWEIDALYNSHKKMRTLIDEWCACDAQASMVMIIDDLFINA